MRSLLRSKCYASFSLSLTGLLLLGATYGQAQEAPIQVDQFLNAFRGKPVGPVAPPPVNASPMTSQPQSPSQAQSLPTAAGQNTSASSQPLCPPGVDRIGCTNSVNQRARADCPAGMTAGPSGCVPMAMPPNAHRVSTDGQWQCDDGFLRFGAVCMSMQSMPSNAHLTGVGSNWDCNTGFRRMGNTCSAISLPPSAHLANTWNGWECDSGFRMIGNWCVAQ
ncbi:hypothetical protein LMG28690_05014 [Paraburkholderia caffeinilytica]|nr:hypothetical protein LMG28690_05014 [Paraburkholderia caffeinilytica]